MCMTVLLMIYCVMYNLGGVNYFVDVVWSIDLPLEEKHGVCVCQVVKQTIPRALWLSYIYRFQHEEYLSDLTNALCEQDLK